MNIARPDWTVARIDDGWRKIDLADPATYGDSPALAKAIEKSRALRRTGFLLVNVPMLDFVWDGGDEAPPSPRHKINWRSMFLVDLGKDGEPPSRATLWVHPDIAATNAAPNVLAAFIPPTPMNESELISAREFLIMSDTGGGPSKPVAESASNERASH